MAITQNHVQGPLLTRAVAVFKLQEQRATPTPASYTLASAKSTPTALPPGNKKAINSSDHWETF